MTRPTPRGYLPLRNESDTYTKDGKTFFVWRFRPGQRVRLMVPVEKLADEVFVLPVGAVVREGPDAYVFRQNGDLFERKPVTVLYEGRTEIVIKNDGSVGAGQFVVRNQAAGAGGTKATTTRTNRRPQCSTPSSGSRSGTAL